MGLMLLQLACVVLVMLRHGTDAQFTAFTKPTAAENVADKGAVTTDVAVVSGVEYTAAMTVLEGVTGTITTVTATITNTGSANAPAYSTVSTEFAVGETNGEVSVATGHTISFANSPYTLVITAMESSVTSNTGTLTITITVNAIPVFSSPTVCWYLPDDQAAPTTVGTYSATDGNGDTITYAVASAGNTNTDFTAAMTGGNLVTANQMAKETTAAYKLTLTAVDNSAVPGTGTVSVAVIIRDVGTTMEACGGASGVVGSLLVVLSLLMAKFL